MANHHIQNGDLSVLLSSKDNPILDDSPSFNLDDETVSQSNEGWGRQANSKKSVQVHMVKHILKNTKRSSRNISQKVIKIHQKNKCINDV